LPLASVRILDLTQVVGPPFGTMLLADMGAEVIRVESRQHWQSTTRGVLARPSIEVVVNGTLMGSGYPDSEPGERPWNRFAMFNMHARNKLSMTVDFGVSEGRELFLQLVRTADGLVENNAAGTLDRLGLDYEVLRERRPDFILVSVSGLGQSGPYSRYRGFGNNIEALSGHTLLRTYPDGTPSSIAVPADAASGVSAAIAFVSALHYRDRTGRGQCVDLSMAENLMPHLGEALMDHAMNGRNGGPMGNRSPYIAQGVYRCAPDADGRDDRWVAVSIDSDAAWEALCGVIGRPDLAADGRFRGHNGRVWHQAEIDAALAEWARGRGHVEAQETLQQAGVAAGGLLTEADLFADRHLWERGFYQEIEHPETGVHAYPVQFFHASRTPERARRHPVRLGEDNEYVYRELLGYSEEKFRALEDAGHIGFDFVPDIP
jgi:benzylsuccinate CoA-transferase BbsF subunit/naphthyl-2-methylsuccinate CoA transferase subunit